jgi:hypothetical protein
LNIRWLFIIGALLSAPLTLAEESTVPEVEINAQREKLAVMRSEMVKLEDEFYTEYNKLNTDHQYDIFCHMEAPLGTRLKDRVCRAVFVDKATEAEAQALLRGETVTPASQIALMKETDYEKNVLAVINKHPELRKLIRERETLGKRYEAVRKQKFKGKLIVFE